MSVHVVTYPALSFLGATLRRIACVFIVFAGGSGALAAEPSAPLAAPAPKPVVELTADILYKTVLAEIAAVRGQIDLAAYLYVDVAQRTQDARLARRATELSLAGNQIELTGKAAKLWAALEPNASNGLQAVALAMSGEIAKLEDMEAPLSRLLSTETLPIEGLMLQLPSLLVRYPDKAAALAMVERLTQPYLHMAEAHFVRAVLALSAGDEVKADRESLKALDLRPDWEPAARLRAQATPKTRRTQAMEALGRFGKRYPHAIGAREDYARWLDAEGRKEDSRDAFERLRADYPDNDDIVFSVMVLMVQSGENEKAEPLMRRLIDHRYRDVDQLRLQLGLILETSSRPDEAVVTYRAVQPGKHYASARARAAQVLIAQGKTEEASAVLGEAIAKNPDSAAELVMAQADLLRRNKKASAALEVLDKYLVSHPDEHEVLYQAAMVAEELKRYGVMEQRLTHLMKVRPDNSSAFNALGYSLVDRNMRLDEAEKLLTQALKLSPDEAAIIDSMGWLRFRQNKFEAAVVLLRKAYTSQADAEIAAHLGDALWKLGRRDEARQVLQDARKNHPKNAALIEVMERLLK